ncbi:MAG TPA: tyrosine-type recombinase/integrase [Verrucomicrobiae bacterium]|nr:tyrosine-type recombinase/integrase [Verrucomicrobiae bacterium]
MLLDARGTLVVDAEQARRAIYGGKKMARRRFQHGSLFRRGRRNKVWVGRWWEEIINPDGSIGRTRRAEVLGTVAELPSRSCAKEILSKRLNPINSGTQRPQSTRSYSDFITKDWMPVVLPTLKYATQKHYRYILDNHLLPTFGGTRFTDIKRECIQSFLAAKLNSGLAWKTVKHIRGVFGRSLTTAENWGYINHNPVSKTELPRRPRALSPKPVLQPNQVRLLTEALSEPSRSIALLLVLTGLRIGELLALRWKAVDLAAGTLRVIETVYDGHFDSPKTDRSARLIPLGAQALALFKRLQQNQVEPNNLVFATRAGGPLNRHNLLRRYLKPACKRLEFGGITWHSLRHSHATMLDATGAPLGTVQALLGHSSSEITREVYLHAIPEDQRKAVASVEALIFGPNWTQVSSASQTSA